MEFGVTSDFIEQPSTLNSSLYSNESDLNVADYEADYDVEDEGMFDNVFKIMYFLVCIVGLFANTISVAATWNIPHGLTTHSKLIISLAFSDGLILLARLSNSFLFLMESWEHCFYTMNRVLLDTGVLATLLNLLAMALDHFFAIMKPMSYRRFMTSGRCNCMIILIWSLSLIIGLLEVLVGLNTEVNFGFPVSFCTKILADDFNTEIFMIVLIFAVLFGVIIFYTRIYFVAKDIIARDNMLYHDEMHNYKAIVTTMLIIGTFTLFWTPLACFKIYVHFHAEDFAELEEADNIVFLLFLLNSLADPFIYATRLSEVQKGYKAMFLKVFPNRRHSTNEEEYRHQNAIYFSKRRDTANTLVNDVNSCPSPDSNCGIFPTLEKRLEETSLMPIQCCENE